MTLGDKIVLGAVAATFGLILVGWHTQRPLIALACPPYEKGYQGYPTQENCASVGVLVIRSLWDVRADLGALIHRYRDDINALSTAAIAVFTATLWWSTRKSIAAVEITANAANHSAQLAERALMEHDRPWVFRDIVQIKWRNTPGVIANDWMISIEWKNVGPQPALLRKFEYGFSDVLTLGADPDYSKCRQFGIVPSLPSGERFATQPIGIGSDHMRPDGTAQEFVFWGRLVYTDMGGRLHHSGFALRIAPIGTFALEHNSDAYNYYD